MPKPTNSSGIILAGAYEVDLGARELRRDGQRVALEELPFEVLRLLVERHGKAVPPQDIRQKLWPAEGPPEPQRSLDLAIRRLKQALGDTSRTPSYVEILPDGRYRFVAKVRKRSARAVPSPDRLPVLVKLKPALKWSLGLILACAAGGAGKLAYDHWQPFAPARIKLAVLPFKCLSGKMADTEVCDGLTDEITARLGRVKPERLGVIGTTSVWRFRDPQQSIQSIGGLLGADHIVEGSVEHQGDQVRISVKLVLVTDGIQSWSQTYDRTFADLLALESEIAERVAAALAVRLLPEEMARLKAFDTTNPEAHEAYVRGRNEWRTRTAGGYQKSVEYYAEAIRLDPNYARAYAGLADVYDTMAFYGILPPGNSYEKARQAARTALRIDPTLAEAHAALAEVLLNYDYDWEGAGEEFQQAIQREMDYATAHDEYGIYLALRGRVEKGIKEIQRAQDLDSGSLVIATNWTLHYFYARNYAYAVEKGERAVKMEPRFALAHFWLGRAYEAQGDIPRAVEELTEAARLQPETPFFLALLGHAYGVSGRKDEARELLRKLQAAAEGRYISSVLLAIVSLGLGDRDQTLTLAERALAEHAPLLTRIKREPILDGLRGEPRFQSLVRQVGPPD
jgi:TolB-like protein/Tfp pilus assembly protein PilF/DNA-binding winged helix-turn-helix (wHTH) protein